MKNSNVTLVTGSLVADYRIAARSALDKALERARITMTVLTDHYVAAVGEAQSLPAGSLARSGMNRHVNALGRKRRSLVENFAAEPFVRAAIDGGSDSPESTRFRAITRAVIDSMDDYVPVETLIPAIASVITSAMPDESAKNLAGIVVARLTADPDSPEAAAAHIVESDSK